MWIILWFILLIFFVKDLLGRVHTKLTKQKLIFFSPHLQQFCIVCQTFLELVCTFRNSIPVMLPVGKDQKVSVMLKVSLPADWSKRSVDLSQCAEEIGLTAWKWSTGETCKFMFFVYSLSVSPKKRLFYIFDARNMKLAAAMHMSSFSLKRLMMY